MPDELERWVNTMSKRLVPLAGKDLLEDTPTDRKFARDLKGSKQQIKFLPKGLTLDVDISIYENKVALTSLEEHLFIVVIESKALYNSMKTIFDLLWEQGVK